MSADSTFEFHVEPLLEAFLMEKVVTRRHHPLARKHFHRRHADATFHLPWKHSSPFFGKSHRFIAMNRELYITAIVKVSVFVRDNVNSPEVVIFHGEERLGHKPATAIHVL